MAQETVSDIKRKLFRDCHGEPKGPWDQFREYLVVEASTASPNVPNWEERALFRMIQHAFDGSGGGKSICVSPYLLHNLAVCAWVALEYDKKVRIPWHDNDDVFNRTYTGFAKTIIVAIKKGELTKHEGNFYFGGLKIPEWFVAWSHAEAVV